MPLTLIGLCINTAAFVLLSLLNASTVAAPIILLIVMLGLGSAVFQSPNTSAIMGSVSRDKLGVAGSINAFFRNFGMVSGTTLAVTLFMAVTKMEISSISGSAFDAVLFLKGFRTVMLAAAAVSLFAVVMAVFRGRIKTAAPKDVSVNQTNQSAGKG